MLHPGTKLAGGPALVSADPASLPPSRQAQALDDLLLGINEWRNIQDVVRITFKAFHDVLRQQGESIRALERTVDTKAGRAEVSVALQQKANASEMSARIAELEAVLHKKADMADMDRRALKSDVNASLRTQMSDVFAVISAKSEATEHKALKESCERSLGLLSGEVTRLQQGLGDARAALHTKATVVEVGQALSLKADIAEVEDKLRDKPSRRQVADALALKADASGVDLAVGQLQQQLSDSNVAMARKADAALLDEAEHRLERLRQRVDADGDSTSLALRTMSTTFDDALSRVTAMADEGEARGAAALTRGLADAEASVSSRLAESEAYLREKLSAKADVDEVQRWLEQKADLEAVAEELDARAPRDGFEALRESVDGALPALQSRVSQLASDAANKAAADRRLYDAIESKAAVEDVNAALVDVCAELERRAAHEHLDLVVADHADLKALVQRVGGGARWLWRSRTTKGGGTVPWNAQALNTDPSNFVWEADKTVVMAMAGGLYRIELGFYCARQPVVQVLVDGQVVLTVVNTPHSAGHLPGGGAARTQPRPHTVGEGGGGGGDYEADGGLSSGNISGATCVDFLSLPARAKIAVTFHGDAQHAQGFLALHKL